MADEISGLTVKVGINADLFTDGTSNIKRGLTALKSEFMLTKTEINTFGSSMDQLKSQQGNLISQIQLHKANIGELTEKYEEAKSKTGETSSATVQLEKQLNNANIALVKTEGALTGVNKKLADQDTDIKKVDWSSFGKKANDGITSTQGKICGLKTAIIGIGTAVAGGGGLFAYADSAIQAGDASYQLSNRLGITTQDASLLSKMLNITGTDSTAFTSTMGKMDKAVLSAGKSGNTTTKALSDYGVKLTDAKGKMLPMTDQLGILSEAYKKSEDAGTSDAFATQVLGNKGAQLIPILEDYTDAKTKASAVVGIGIDPKEAHETAQQLATLKLQVQQTGSVVAKALIPIVSQLLPPTVKLFQDLATQVKANKPQLDNFLQSALNIGKGIVTTLLPPIKDVFNFVTQHGEAAKNIILGIGVGFVALSVVKGILGGIKIATEAWTVAQGIFNAVMDANPVAIFVLAVVGLIAIGVTLYENWGTISAGLKVIFTAIKTAIGEAFNGAKDIVMTVFNGIVGFGRGCYSGITGAFSAIGGFFGGIWNGVKSGAEGAYNGITGVFNKVGGFFSGIGADIKRIWDGIWNFKLPHIPLPHFNISGKFSLDPPSIPSMGVNWYAKGGVFNSAQTIGVGENGKEAVMPLENNTGWIDELASKINNKMGNIGKSDTPTYVIIQVDGKEFARATAKPMSKEIAYLNNKENQSVGRH